MKKCLSCCAGFSLFCVIGLFPEGRAEVPASTRILTWEDCVQLALQKNPVLTSSRRAEQAGQESYRGSFNGLLPTLSLTNGYATSNTAGSATNKYSAQATASANLFSASTIANIKTASASWAQAMANLRQASAALRFTLRQAFAQVIFAQKSLEVSLRIRDMRDRDSQLVTLRYQSGNESKGNMLRAQAQLVQANADLAQGQRNLRAAQRALDQQLGFDDFEVVSVTGTLSAAAAPESPGDESSYLASRPDVILQEAVVKSAAAALDSARSSLWPTLTGSYTRSRAGAEFPGDSNNGWTGALTLSLPLFSGGPTATYYAVSAAKSGLQKAEQDLRSVRDAAIVDLENTWSSYAGSVDQVKVQHALLEAARQRNDEADVRYASGLLTYDNWEIIASDRINQEKLAVSADFNAVVSQAAWEKSLGKELGE